MRTIFRPIMFLLIFSLGHFGVALAQGEGNDVVLVQGNPPLTQLTVGKTDSWWLKQIEPLRRASA